MKTGRREVILSSQVVSLPLQEVANFCAAMDTLIGQGGGCKLLCSNGHLDRSRWRLQTFMQQWTP